MANLTDAQVDALCEMGSIGSGNAATALSKLISELIHISVPAVKLLPINQVAEVLGGAGKETYIIYLDVESKVSGTMVTILSPQTADFLISKLLRADEMDTESDIYQSALQEVGSILCGSYLSALSQIVREKFIASVPMMACDMLGAMLDFVLLEVGQVAEEVLLIETELIVSEQKLECSQLFLPKPESLKELLATVGM